MKVRLPDQWRGACLACGSTVDLTDEHVISRTVRRQIPLLSKVTETFAGDTRKPMDVLHMVIADAVCSNCNGGWMGRLESDFVKIIRSNLTDPIAKAFEPGELERVAMWAIKTAIWTEVYTTCLGLGAYAPLNNLRWMAKHNSPPPNSRVWMIAVNSGVKRLAWSQAGGISDGQGKAIGALITFHIGCVGFQVLAFDFFDPKMDEPHRTTISIDPPPAFAKAMLEICPGTGTAATWPANLTVVTETIFWEYAKWHMTVLPPEQ